MIVRLLQAAVFGIGFRAGYRWRRRRNQTQLNNQTHPHLRKV